MQLKRLIWLFACGFAVLAPRAAGAQADVARWEAQAQNVTIIRDDWGIAHVFGGTDADAVFGMIYAQAEDDFNRVEVNYLNAIGRLAEAEGESEIYRDLRMKLFIDPDSIKVLYARSPSWLKTLMVAWADGLNFFLYKHPEVHPRVITRFEPWMALTFTEGSIGGDIERVNIRQLQAFYEGRSETSGGEPERDVDIEPTGSNGIAIAPANTINRHALFLINPHTSFYFRSELQMVSEEGLAAYGAVTWGQFFVYQGFNDRVGWMHTSSGVDNIDEFLETVVERNGRWYYHYGDDDLPMATRTITVPYKTDDGMAEKTFTAYYTRHGPIVRATDDRWVSVSLMQNPIDALTQSYTRTKARSYDDFLQTMQLHTNSSNNTVYADADGNIAYFHSNFIPRRDASFDWRQPVDGSNPATDWNGVLSVDETPNVLNPSTGWLYNSNNWPWSAAGAASPKREDYPVYVDRGRAESARGHHAIRVLENKTDFTLSSLLEAAYDSYLPAFEESIPRLLDAYDQASDSDPLKTKLREPIAILRGWDLRWAVNSIPTSLAVFWGTELGRGGAQASPEELLQALDRACDRLAADFGSWMTPWGEINRFQRISPAIRSEFDDAQPSIPVGFTSSRWGSLASFGARPYPNTKKWYGTSGNSFVAVVEFGDSVRALAVTAGGESGDPDSPHFNDEAERYATGNLRWVYFYRRQLEGHTEREYHPGG
jgi:acyl-homoserine-lactone acylase